MFRAACDNSVTTSAARQPTHSKPAHPEMPTSLPGLHQTRPDMSKVTTAPPTQHAHQPSLCQADDGDQYRVLVVAPDSPLPGSPTIDRT